MCNEFEKNDVEDIVVQDRCHYLHFHRSSARPNRILVSPFITNRGKYRCGPHGPVLLTEKPLGLWLALIVGRHRKANRRKQALVPVPAHAPIPNNNFARAESGVSVDPAPELRRMLILYARIADANGTPTSQSTLYILYRWYIDNS